jgi:hypothetical protein
MVRVPIQGQQGASVFGVSVQAQSIRRAVSIAASRRASADEPGATWITTRRPRLERRADAAVGSLVLGIAQS